MNLLTNTSPSNSPSVYFNDSGWSSYVVQSHTNPYFRLNHMYGLWGGKSVWRSEYATTAEEIGREAKTTGIRSSQINAKRSPESILTFLFDTTTRCQIVVVAVAYASAYFRALCRISLGTWICYWCLRVRIPYKRLISTVRYLWNTSTVHSGIKVCSISIVRVQEDCRRKIENRPLQTFTLLGYCQKFVLPCYSLPSSWNHWFFSHL